MEINKIVLAKAEDYCAFCNQSEKDVKFLFIGSMGKGICDSCVGYVREDMGLIDAPSTGLQKILETSPDKLV